MNVNWVDTKLRRITNFSSLKPNLKKKMYSDKIKNTSQYENTCSESIAEKLEWLKFLWCFWCGLWTSICLRCYYSKLFFFYVESKHQNDFNKLVLISILPLWSNFFWSSLLSLNIFCILVRFQKKLNVSVVPYFSIKYAMFNLSKK